MRDKPLNINSKLPNLIDTAFGFVVSGKLYSNIDNLSAYEKKMWGSSLAMGVVVLE